MRSLSLFAFAWACGSTQPTPATYTQAPVSPQSNGVPVSGGRAEAAASASRLFTAPDGPAPCPQLGLAGTETRYVCDCGPGAAKGCVPGDDSAQGTREAPLRSYSRARDLFRSQPAGQTIAFCRGGSFAIEGERDWTNAACQSDRPCVVRDYVPSWASGDLPLPRLQARDGDGITLVNGGPAEREAGFVFQNLELRSASGGKAGNGFFLYNDVDDVLICGVSVDGFAIGVHSGGGNPPGPGSDGKNARIVLRNARLTNNGDQGWLGGCDGCGIAHSIFENNGFNRAILNHSIYFGGAGTDMFALGNRLYRSAIVDGKCQGAPIVAHGQLNGLRIEGNLVREELGKALPTCWGIAVDAGYEDRVEAFHRVIIRNNEVVNVGSVGIGVNACQACVIEDNVIVHEQPFESTLIAVPTRKRRDDDLSLGPVVVRGNRLVARGPAQVVGVRVGGEASGHVVVDNALLSMGPGRLTCFDYDLAPNRYGERDRNVCHAPGGTHWTRAKPEIGAWQRETGADRASSSNDPRLHEVSRPRWKRVDGSSLEGFSSTSDPKR